MGDVFFDATPWRRAVVDCLRQNGVAMDYPGFCRRWEAKLVPVYLGRQAYWDAFGELLVELGLPQAARGEVLAFAHERAREAENRILFEGVAETLARLQQAGLRLAVLSDTESREPRVRQRLARLGIEACFDAVVTSIDIGEVKPSPAAYAAALDRLRVTAAEAVFVGHDEEELAGARRCGLTTVAFNHESGTPADYHLRHFKELLSLPGLDVPSPETTLRVVPGEG
jgi:HAD superfamily hydrolase (TIGR01509 family)